mgnify:CR=1 FL=1
MLLVWLRPEAGPVVRILTTALLIPHAGTAWASVTHCEHPWRALTCDLTALLLSNGVVVVCDSALTSFVRTDTSNRRACGDYRLFCS